MIDDPLQMNDWGIKKFLIVVGSFQISVLCLAALGSLGIAITLIPQIIGFIYLTFLPGVIILRILRMHRLGSVVSLLYAVGLSVTFNMFLGFLINLVYPMVGIAHPISPVPLFATWTIVLGLLCICAYLRDKDYSHPDEWKLTELLSPPVLFFMLLPLLAIAGTSVVNYYDNNIILLGLIALITVVAIVMVVTKFIPTHLYPLAIFSIALALLWHTGLISNHLTGNDIFTEYYFYSQIAQHGIWDQAISTTYNNLLSITILPAGYSYFMNMAGELVFKIVYPLLYALVPVALYMIYSKQIGNRQGFAAAFFFMSIFTFFRTIPAAAKQGVGQLFYVLMIMLILDKQITSSRKILFILFGASLVVSHYSMAYIFMVFIILSLISLYLVKERKSQITLYAVILFGVICLAWYMFLSGAAPLKAFLAIGENIYKNIILDFFNVFNREPAHLIASTSPDIIHLIDRLIYYLIVFFTAAGALRLLPGRNNRFSIEYLAFAAGSYALLAAAIIVPFFAESIGTMRMFHVSAIILAPFTILGFEDSLKVLGRLPRFPIHRIFGSFTKIAMSVLLALFFLYNSGFIYEIVHDPFVESLPLSYGYINKNTGNIDIDHRVSLRSLCPTEQEIASAEWLASEKGVKLFVYATFADNRVPSLIAYGLIPLEKTIPILPPGWRKDIKHAYIYLGYVNIVYGYGVTDYIFFRENFLKSSTWDITALNPVLADSLEIYDNGASVIYLSP